MVYGRGRAVEGAGKELMPDSSECHNFLKIGVSVYVQAG